MGKQKLAIIVFIFSFISLLISVKLFINLGFFVDEYGLSPSIVDGGDFWLYMDWLRLFLLLMLSIGSGVSIFSAKQK
ncbi:hypothetical protein [Pradoshia sp.]